MFQSDSFTSIGRAAAELQRPVVEIEHCAESLGINPAFLLNNVPHFDANGLSRIAAGLRSSRPTGKHRRRKAKA